MKNTVLTVAQMRKADGQTIDAGTTGIELMRRAGEACAKAILARYEKAAAVVLCGPGNNGGDGYVIARLLEEQGWNVTVSSSVSPADLKGDARLAYEEWIVAARAPVLAPFSASLLEKCDVVVDALFGTGLSRPLEAPVAALAQKSAELGLPVVAVDCPSGVLGDSGQIAGPNSAAAFQCDLTVTFHRKKPCHLMFPGRGLCGAVIVADIGIADGAGLQEGEPFLRENTPESWLADFPWPRLETHKYERGHTLVVSGGVSATGAARLAARGALRVGAGLVTVASPSSAVLVHAAQLTAIMVRGMRDFEGFAKLVEDPRLNAFVVGPGNGVGEETRQRTLHLLASGRSIVLDADALTSFEEAPEAVFEALHDKSVLTPHAGEFKRLFPDLVGEAGLDAARSAAVKTGAVIVLKGPDTAIADPHGNVVINANAPATLATAGSGDVLAGLIAGLMAQGMDAMQAACAGVWVHGEAATLFGPGLISEDLPDLVPEVLDVLQDWPQDVPGGEL